jgi:hypothetical protein
VSDSSRGVVASRASDRPDDRRPGRSPSTHTAPARRQSPARAADTVRPRASALRGKAGNRGPRSSHLLSAKASEHGRKPATTLGFAGRAFASFRCCSMASVTSKWPQRTFCGRSAGRIGWKCAGGHLHIDSGERGLLDLCCFGQGQVRGATLRTWLPLSLRRSRFH